MSEQTAQKERYTVSVYEAEEVAGSLIFTFVPKGHQPERGPRGLPKRVPQFIVEAHQTAGEVTFDWSETPDDPGAEREEMEAEIAVRLRDRESWIKRITGLVAQVEQWAKELDWSTRHIEKSLEDDWIGKHKVPALLMQEDVCRFLLEPLGRSTYGAEGVVDLYLMPAYDDIASLLYYDDQWHLHYRFPGDESAATVREAEALPLSKETLGKVIADMRQHAA